MKQKIYHLVESGAHGNRNNKIFDNLILLLILLSIVSIILESIPEFNSEYGRLLEKFNGFTIAVFTIEYLLRLYVSDLTHPTGNKLKSALKFMFSFYGMIDLLAILPFYLPRILTLDLRFIRSIRLTRFLRIFKLNRYNKSLHLIGEVIAEKRSELTVTGFLAVLVLLIASFLMYFIEGEAQPEAFSSIPDSLWWAVITLTSVGYGDVVPVTTLGKFVGGVISILGVGIIALPTGFISAGFKEKLSARKEEKVERNINTCPHCGKEL
jgi:voltage-gated potassium channel